MSGQAGDLNDILVYFFFIYATIDFYFGSCVSYLFLGKWTVFLENNISFKKGEINSSYGKGGSLYGNSGAGGIYD